MSRSKNTPQRKKRKYICKCSYCINGKTHTNTVRQCIAKEKMKEFENEANRE